MNLGKRAAMKNTYIRVEHTNPDVVTTMSRTLLSWIPAKPREYVVVFIGTDRSTGDALGPLAGSYLTELKPRHLFVYGTLHDPVHATNLETYINLIYQRHHNPFIIAVDACLGKSSSVGSLIAEKAPLQPGAALNKILPEIGNVHISGIVNVGGFMSHSVLQSTRLSVVVDISRQIASVFDQFDKQLTYLTIPPAVKRL